jgi:hypothetical protein
LVLIFVKIILDKSLCMYSVSSFNCLDDGILAKRNSTVEYFLFPLIAILIFLNGNAQNEPYLGGAGRGDVQLTSLNNLLDKPFIYYGGSGRGDIQLTRMNSLLDDPLIYYGGSGRGDIQLMRVNNLLDDPLIYYGGSGRGDIQLMRTNNLLDDPLIYYGGSGRGDIQLTRTNNLLDDPLIYYGGSGRGDVQLTRTNNLLDAPLIYYGGSGRGDVMLGIGGHLNKDQTWIGPMLSGNNLFSNGANWALGYPPQLGNIKVDNFAQRDMELVAHLQIDTLFFQNSTIKVQHGNYNMSLTQISNSSSTQLWRFQTDGAGSLVKPGIESGSSFTFPVGRSTYNPVTITNNTGTADDFSVRVTDAVLVGGASGNAITTPHVNRTWHIGKNNPSANSGNGVDMSFQWDSAQETGTMAAYKLNSHNGGGWVFASGYGGSESVSGINPKTLNYTGYKGSFSLFAIGGSPVSPLPIVLAEFTAVCEDEGVMLNWITESEINNERFFIHRSADLIQWEEVLTLPGAGNSNAPLSYNARDERPLRGISYYRLTQQDYDGAAESFDPVSVYCRLEDAGNALHVYPNPAEDVFSVSLYASQTIPESILELSDLNGRVVVLHTIFPVKGNNSFLFYREGLVSGTYILRLRSDKLALPPVKVVLK